MATMKLNGENFNNGIHLWVSDPITSKKTGEIVYWATIDEYQDGTLLYLAHSVWEKLETVNEETVLAKILAGGFEIREAKDVNTGELLYTEDGEQIFMIAKAKKTAFGEFK